MILLLLLAAFTASLFGAQIALPDGFGCRTFFGEDFSYLYVASRLALRGHGAAIFDPLLFSGQSIALLAEIRQICGPGIPAVYWPAFLMPFFPIAFLSPRLAYYLWTAFTVLVFAFALWRLAQARGVPPLPFWLIGLGFFPLVGGLLTGQVHGLQFLAIVEFWLAMRLHADRSAGFWLSLQLVKFQFLPLVLLYLLWYRRWQVLSWFSIASVLWLTISIALVDGGDGVAAYLNTMLHVVAPLDAPIGVPHMMNWRAVAFRWFGDSGFGTAAFTAALTLLTISLAMWSWHRRQNEAARLEPRIFLVLMAGAVLTGYDTHTYSVVLLLVPALLFLVELRGRAGFVTEFWSALLDFTLLAPMLLLSLAFTLGITLWLRPGDALLLGIVALFVTGVFLPEPDTKSSAGQLAGQRALVSQS